MLELLQQELKTTMINKLRALMDKVDSMQEQIGNINRDGNPLKEPKKKKMLEIENTVTEMSLISRLNTTEKRI